VYVACSSLCFAKYPLDQVFKTITELQFQKVDLALHERGPHLRPSEVAADVGRAAQRLKHGSHLALSAFHVRIEAPDGPDYANTLQAVCRLARLTTVPVVCVPAAAAGSDLDVEVSRLQGLTRLAAVEGVILTVETHSESVTADPRGAVELCKRVPGLGLTLDPSHYLLGPHRDVNFDIVYPFVRHVRLRDTGGEPGQFQVRVGQGQMEFNRVVSQLERYRYNRVLSVDVQPHPNLAAPVESEVRKLKYLLESMV
jgi:sugar phosphate isomerase/epimerase